MKGCFRCPMSMRELYTFVIDEYRSCHAKLFWNILPLGHFKEMISRCQINLLYGIVKLHFDAHIGQYIKNIFSQAFIFQIMKISINFNNTGVTGKIRSILETYWKLMIHFQQHINQFANLSPDSAELWPFGDTLKRVLRCQGSGT